MKQTKNILKTEITIRSFYKVGAAAAFLAALIFRRNWSAEVDLYFPIDFPVTVLEWFNLIHDNRLLGLIMLDFLDILNNALVGIIFFTLYYVLKDTNEIYMRFANILCFIGITVYFASNQAFTMLSLSDQYFAASEAQKSVFLTAGEAILASMNQSSGIYVSMFLIGLSGLIISIIMLPNIVFNRITAYIGIFANGAIAIAPITMIIVPSIGWLPIPLSSIPLMIWYILIGIKLYRLSRSDITIITDE